MDNTADETVFGPSGQPQKAAKRRPMLRPVLMFCACGQRMYRHTTTGGGPAYYRCANRQADDPDQRDTRLIPCDDAGQPTS